MSSTIGVENISHTNGTNAITVSSGGDVTVVNGFTSKGIDDNATSTAITVDASQNVGIGTSSPNLGSNGTGLHIKSASGDYGVLKVDSSTTSEEGWVQFSNNSVDKFRIASDSSTNLKFIHSGVAERMRIDSAGNLLLGKTSHHQASPVFALLVMLQGMRSLLVTVEIRCT